MSPLLHFCHRLVLGLLLGGMVMLALIVTPPLFLQLGIDQASQATAVIFPLYFRYVLLLFTLGLGLSLLLPKGRWWKLQLVLWAFGLSANLVQLNWLLPEAESLRTQIGNFATTPKDNPQRQAFGKLHGLSNGINLLVLLAVLGLLVVQPSKQE